MSFSIMLDLLKQKSKGNHIAELAMKLYLRKLLLIK